MTINPSDTSGNPSLDSAHERYLEARGVPVALALRSGIRSMSAGELAPYLGYAPPAGGIGIPYAGVDPAYVRVRLDTEGLGPDAPRFMTPVERQVPVYIPPFNVDPKVPVVVVEGPIKALSLVDGGVFAVGLGGVATTLDENGDLNDSWRALPLKDRHVLIAFDSNRGKPPIALAEARLGVALERAGAKVWIVRIPAGPGGDWGPDDYKAAAGIAAFHDCCRRARLANPLAHAERLMGEVGSEKAIPTLLDDSSWLFSVLARSRGERQQIKRIFKRQGAVREFERALADARSALAASVGDDERTGSIYVMSGGRTILVHEKGNIVLARFEARIEREVVVDDGAEVDRRFELEGMTDKGATLPPIRMTAAALLRGAWPLQQWGVSAIVQAGASTQDHLRVAIQELFAPEVVKVFGHTGWRELDDGTQVFLHSGGALGADAVLVELGDDLARYELPAAGGPAAQAFAVALQLLDIAQDRITVPLLLAVFRAPLMKLLPMDAAMHLFGSTGSMKSTVAALYLSFFGHFDTASLPASFMDTFGALERKANLLHDVLLVVDEFVPTSADSADEMRRTATKFFRYIANRSPRGRLRSDLTSRPGRPPNALIVTTGEDVPAGESIVARTLTIEFKRGEIDVAKLTAAQQMADMLPHVTVAYIAWLRDRLSIVEQRLTSDFPVLRDQLSGVGSHRRAASTAAHLMLAAELIAELGMALGVLDQTTARALVDRLQRGLLAALAAQREVAVAVSPGRHFLEVLAELLAAGVVQLDSGYALDGRGPVVGHVHGANVLLFKDVAVKEAMELVRRQGGRLAAGPGEILRSLRDEQLMTPGDGDHLLPKRTVAGRSIRVIEVDASLLTGAAPTANAPTLPNVYPIGMAPRRTP